MPQTKFNIFLVDDDLIYQFTAKKTLEAMGMQGMISSFTDGEKAMDFISSHLHQKEELPDIIFLDINMPVMDGWEFIEAFQRLSLPKKIHIYMVSSSVDEQDLQRSKQYASIEDYIVKPVGRTCFEELLQRSA